MELRPYEEQMTPVLAKRLQDRDIYFKPEYRGNRRELIERLRGSDIRQESIKNPVLVSELPRSSTRVKASIKCQDWKDAISTDIVREEVRKIGGFWYRFINASHIFGEPNADLSAEVDSELEDNTPEVPDQGEDESSIEKFITAADFASIFDPEQKYENWTVENIKTELKKVGIEFDKSVRRDGLMETYVPKLKRLDRRVFNKLIRKKQRSQKRKRPEYEEDDEEEEEEEEEEKEGDNGDGARSKRLKMDEGEQVEQEAGGDKDGKEKTENAVGKGERGGEQVEGEAQ